MGNFADDEESGWADFLEPFRKFGKVSQYAKVLKDEQLDCKQNFVKAPPTEVLELLTRSAEESVAIAPDSVGPIDVADYDIRVKDMKEEVENLKKAAAEDREEKTKLQQDVLPAQVSAAVAYNRVARLEEEKV